MLSYSITSITGWLMMILLIATIVYPFLLRSGVLGPVQPFLARMRVNCLIQWRKFLQLSDVMAALLFSFNNDGKSFAGRFKDFHFGKAYRDIRQIIIKKVPHRMKQFTNKGCYAHANNSGT